MRHLFCMVAVILAVGLGTSPIAWAQEPPNTDDEGFTTPTDIFADAKVLWVKDENPARLARNYRLFSQAVIYYRENAPGALANMIKRHTKGKSTALLLKEAGPLTSTGLRAVAPLAPFEFVDMMKDWLDWVKLQGCDPGTPESDESKSFYETSHNIARTLIGLLGDKQLTAEAEGLLGEITDAFRKDPELEGTVDDYLMMALFAQAAVFSLPSRMWLPLVADEDHVAGVEVSLADLAGRYGDHLTTKCIGFLDHVGTLDGASTDKVLKLNRKKKGLGQAEVKDLEHCRLFALPSTAPNKCEEGVDNFENDVLYGNTEWLKECPEDLESLVGRNVLRFPEECKDSDGKSVSEPMTGEITEVSTDMGGAIMVKFADGTVEKFDCADLGMLALLPETETVVDKPGLGYLSMGPEVRGGVLLQDGLEGGGYVMSGLRLDFTPWAGNRVAFHMGTGILFGKVWGLDHNSISQPDSRFDLMVPIRIGASVFFNKVVSMSIFGDVRFTRAGFGGGGGELGLNVTPHERVTLSLGPTIGYSIFGVKPGTNHWYADCNSGAPCTKMPEDTRGVDVGGFFTLRINLGLKAARKRAEAKTNE